MLILRNNTAMPHSIGKHLSRMLRTLVYNATKVYTVQTMQKTTKPTNAFALRFFSLLLDESVRELLAIIIHSGFNMCTIDCPICFKKLYIHTPLGSLCFNLPLQSWVVLQELTTSISRSDAATKSILNDFILFLTYNNLVLLCLYEKTLFQFFWL